MSASCTSLCSYLSTVQKRLCVVHERRCYPEIECVSGGVVVVFGKPRVVFIVNLGNRILADGGAVKTRLRVLLLLRFILWADTFVSFRAQPCNSGFVALCFLIEGWNGMSDGLTVSSGYHVNNVLIYVHEHKRGLNGT